MGEINVSLLTVEAVSPAKSNISLKLKDISFNVLSLKEAVAHVSTQCCEWVQKLALPNQFFTKSLKSYNSGTHSLIGKEYVSVGFSSFYTRHGFYVVEDNNVNLCSRDLMTKFVLCQLVY